ncbi:MAG: GNAT family N-acetyltransferase [Candidatus Peribacteraceae bacterium]|nr:GNAT family N-acetyltransferase [Candidatus Peribacteraceae bacterium]
MIRQFLPSDKQTILDFAYQREKENMFVIGSFTAYPKPFSQNVYLGCYKDSELIGIGTHFEKRFGSLVINSQSNESINEIVDGFISRDAKVEWVPAFKQYAVPIIERLRFHGIKPKKISEETVFLLTHETFEDYSTGETAMATKKDIEEIIKLNRAVESEKIDAPITNRERKQVIIGHEWLLRKDGKIVSKANIHGVSKSYIQIGGVATHPDHQGKGYAKQTVSAVCNHWLEHEKEVILFTNNDNEAANKVYNTLGFKPIDEYIIAEY